MEKQGYFFAGFFQPGYLRKSDRMIRIADKPQEIPSFSRPG